MPKITRRHSLQLLSTAALAPFAAHVAGKSLWALPAQAAFVSNASVGAAHAIPPALYGFNAGDTLTRFLDDPAFMKTFAQLAPSILRYPGGNGANWFDLSTGGPIKDPVVPTTRLMPSYSGAPFDFKVYKKFLDQGHTQPSIVLNLLTGKLEPQIEALKHAKAIGIPMTRIELGNEYYLTGLPGSENAYESVFADGAAYARVANQYAKALKREFPECHLGVPIRVHEGGVGRGQQWNSQVLGNIEPAIDAVIPHVYYDPSEKPFGGKHSRPSADALTERGGPQEIFAMIFNDKQLAGIRESLGSRPYRIWVTETNVRDFGGSVAGTWTHGLFVALDMMNLLNLPNLDQALIHALVGGKIYGAILTLQAQHGGTVPESGRFQPDQLSASGYGCMLLFKAARGKTSAAPLHFDNNPTQKGLSSHEIPSLYGWAFGTSSALVLNLSAQACDFKIADPQLGASPYFQLAGDPTAYVGTPLPLASVRGKSSHRIALPPYSMTLIGDSAQMVAD